MQKSNIIKWIIIAALILGEIAVWTFPYEEFDALGSIPKNQEQPEKDLDEQEPAEKPESSDTKGNTAEKPSDSATEEEVPIIVLSSDEAEAAGLLLLVNKKQGLEKNYVPKDMKPVLYFARDRSEEGRYLQQEAAGQFNQMAEDALAEGIEFVMTTAYRSFGFQTTLYNNYVAASGQAEADKFSARPGFSEHQTGLAVDVSSASVGYALTVEFENTAEWEWLNRHAAEYGFIQRYPKDKTEITGYMYEPWHFRYVGVEAATVVQREKITLEEYLDK